MHTAALSSSSGSLASSSPSRVSAWCGYILSALAVLFLTFDTVIKVLQLPVAVRATQQLGFTANAVFVVGVIQALCLALYLVPRTAVLGAALWIGYLGGAIATHIRAESPLFTHTLFPIYIAALLWAGLWLRDGRLRRILRTTFDAAA
jgi:hypothetical protein